MKIVGLQFNEEITENIIIIRELLHRITRS